MERPACMDCQAQFCELQTRNTSQNSLINIVTIMLGLAVGSKLAADKFLNIETVGILLLGLGAFVIGTAVSASRIGMISGTIANTSPSARAMRFSF